MNITEKKAFCRQLIDTVWNEGKVDALDKFAAPNHKYTDPAASYTATGIEPLKKYALSLRKAFPDLHFKFEDQIAEGDKVVSFLTVTGTHEAEFLGIPASHKKASLPLILIHRFEGDKIVEAFGLWDALSFARIAGAFEMHEPVFAGL